MTRWLVTGATGQLGTELVALLTPVHEVLALRRADLDVRDPVAVSETVRSYRPDVVANTAAYTAVDAAESDESGAWAANVDGPAALAAVAAEVGATLLHLSTDYVFAGDAASPYPETAPVAPRTVYGRTKAAGERAALASGGHAYVVRTAWLYGAHGANFVKTMVRLERERATIDVVDDQIGSPTWSRHLAAGLVELVAGAPAPGIYHWVNGGQASWWELARAVFAGVGADPERVRPVRTTPGGRPAPRPRYSVLGTGRLAAAGLPSPAPWPVALTEALTDIRGPQRPPERLAR